MPTNGTTEQTLAKALTNVALAHRIEMILANRRAFSKAQADAYLDEAAIRLRWRDVYVRHSVETDPIGVPKDER